MNLLLENSEQMPLPVDMRLVFSALSDTPEGYDWLITDLECNFFPDERFSRRALLIAGEELADILNEHDIQFYWAVFSALPKGTRPDLSDEELLPCADTNPDFWSGSPQVQLPEALFEIVCWDGCATLLIGASPGLADEFGRFFTDAIDLDRYNRERKNRNRG